MNAVLAVSLAPTEPISRQVTRALRQAIVSMRLKPGEMLSEQDIATRFGVSRQPVREAFIKLGEAGLVRVLPQRGTLVVKISTVAVEDARFIRQAVECAVAQEAALRATSSALSALSNNVARQRRAAKGKDVEAFFSLDEDFHRLLAETAGRPLAWRIVEDVKPQMDRVRFLSVDHATPMRVIIDQHASIIDAIRARDAAGAEAAMRHHLTEILKSLPQLAERFPELFENATR